MHEVTFVFLFRSGILDAHTFIGLIDDQKERDKCNRSQRD